MPDNKKSAVSSKKNTVAKKNIASKNSKTTIKNAKAAVNVSSEKKNSSKKVTSNQKKVTLKKNLPKTANSSKNKAQNNGKKITSKDTKKKAAAKVVISKDKKEDSIKELDIQSSKKEKESVKSKKTSKFNILVFVKDKFRRKKSKSDSLKDKKKIRLKNEKDSVKFNDKKKNKKTRSKFSLNLHISSDAPIFSFNSKKWLIVVASICVVIILAEVGYLIYHQIVVDRRNIYYDSLNSLAIDDTDIVAVGSSNFRYSKYNDYTKGLEKAKFIKYDKNGKIIFEKMYEEGINTTFSSIISVNDGYVVVGSGEFSKEEQNDGAREAVIIKYDKDGNIIWNKYYQVVTNTRFNKVIATSDGYIAIGQSIYANMEMGNHTTGGGIIVKYDFDGNEVWHNNHGGMKSGNFNDVVEVNGNFYVVGKDATDYANIVKYDKDGKYQWHKNYGYTDGIGFTGIAYLDNSLYVVGSKKILPEGTGDEDNRDTKNTDALLVKYDLDGKIIFEKNFGGSNYERYNSILNYRDSLYAIGHTSSKDAGFKINTDGELMTGILVRYDSDGNILKKEAFGGSNNDNLTDIVTDGISFYISAYSNSNDGNITTSHNNGKDYFGKVIKLDFKFRALMVK